MLVGTATRYFSTLSTRRFLPILSLSTLLCLAFIMHSSAASPASTQALEKPFHFRYTTVTGFFFQSEPETDDRTFDFKKENFGLIDREYEKLDEEAGDGDEDGRDAKKQWRRFEKYVRRLNKKSEEGVQYKVVFLGRHGQGWHNVAETKYGTEAWDCYYSMLDGAEGITWADANLTDIGRQQARDVHELWKSLLPRGIPVPETFYVSPLTRAMQTADLSFEGLHLPGDRRYEPVVKELLREAIGVHTCDRRRSASYIRAAFPSVTLEAGFAEADPLWTSDFREPRLARRYRLAQLLDDVFAHDDGVFLSFTSHSGAIGSILEVIGHRNFGLETGGVIPVFIRSERVGGERPAPPDEPSADPPSCPTPAAAALDLK